MKENGLKGIVGKCLRAVGLFAMGMVLAGCGGLMGSVTSLNINGDFSGTRVMKLGYSQATAENLRSALPNIQANAYATLPAELSLDVSPDGAKYTYTVSLPFSSREDYQAKVQRLIAFNRSCFPSAYYAGAVPVPEITFIQGADGEFFYKENFTDMDLINGWLTKAHYDAGIEIKDEDGNYKPIDNVMTGSVPSHFFMNGRDCALSVEPLRDQIRIDSRRISTTGYYDSNDDYQHSPYESWTWVQNAEGQWQFCSPAGEPLRNRWIDNNYYVDGNGFMVTGWFQDPLTQYWHYFYEDSTESHKQGQLATYISKDGGHIDQDGVWTKDGV
jgi:hypothetical protein